ncbi:hypothetical protein NCC49_004094 [Naganishia albida]|nr:hypothetical protein NCC49_004094 [Naganishia albida]
MSIRSDTITTLTDHISHLESLETQAKELMPFRVDECSFSQGYVRQKVWSCRTCSPDGQVGVCYACSVSCHAEHDLVELFTRRQFRCDCPPSTKCTLSPPQPRNEGNTYGRNFKGEFCRCERGKRYDPMEESESMVMCLACQDWFHESCLNLQDPTNPTPISEAGSTTSSESVESPLLPSSTYQHLICASCTLKSPLLRRHAGTEGWLMIVPKAGTDASTTSWPERWEVIGRWVGTGEKRKAQDEEAGEGRKRVKLSPSIVSRDPPAHATCTRPAPNPDVQLILSTLVTNPTDPESGLRAKGDVFLPPGALEGICTCPSCAEEVKALPFPLVEEPEYEPAPEDPNDPTEEELATRALERLPRGQTIEALLAFNSMKDKLKAFLEPFRDGGKVVSAGDIEEFMAGIKESRRP